MKVTQSRPTLQPHGLYSPWNSPGQNTGAGSLSLLQGIFPIQGSNPGLPHCRRILYQLSHKGSPCDEPLGAAAAAKSLQSCPTLCDPIDRSPLGFSVPGILQARTLEWVAISFSNAWKWRVKVKSLSRARLLATPWTAAYQAPPSMDFLGKSTGVGCHCLFQGLFFPNSRFKWWGWGWPCPWAPGIGTWLSLAKQSSASPLLKGLCQKHSCVP